MKVWSKYGSMLNDPVRSLNLKLSLQNGDVATAIPREVNVSKTCKKNSFIQQPFHPVGNEFSDPASGLR